MDNNIITDEKIIEIFYIKDKNKLKTTKLTSKWLNKNIDLLNYLKNRFIDSESIKETVFRIIHKIYIRPVCITCGGKVNFDGRPSHSKYLNQGFNWACSNKCSTNNDNVIKKYKNTCMLKYGVDNPWKSELIKEKIKQTSIKKFGVDHYSKTKTFKDKYKDLNFIKSAKEKEYKTKKSNGSFLKSKEENYIYYELCNIFNKNDIIRNYKDYRYPFMCDFYIKSLDLFIEYNGWWHHGKHPFNETNPDDINIIKMWEHKENILKTKKYAAAIHTWSIRDVNKRNTAKKNNIRYLEIWREDLKTNSLLNLINNII